MSKIYISIYASKATNISNLYHKLTKYSERVNNEPYKICGENVYISNFTFNDEIIVDELIDEIEYICNRYK